MQPVHEAPFAPTAHSGSPDLVRALIAAMIAVLLAGSFIAGLAILTSQPSTVTTADVQARDVVDGWSSYLGAAAQPADRPVVDGWSSYLLAPEMDPTTVVDGWSSYLLAPEIDPATVIDGWSSYLLAPEIDPATVIDGWMTRYGRND
jgi:hypothetical protein